MGRGGEREREKEREREGGGRERGERNRNWGKINKIEVKKITKIQ